MCWILCRCALDSCAFEGEDALYCCLAFAISLSAYVHERTHPEANKSLKSSPLTAAPVQEIHPHYDKAPILEALIDFRVSSGAPTPLDPLGQLDLRTVGEYPTRDSINEQQVAFVGGAQPAVSSRDVGYRYTSADKKRVLQVQSHGFTFSRLPPYESWAPFCEEARKLWRLYISVRKPELVTRIAVRYINRLELPLPIDDFTAYLRNVPDVSPDLPQGLSGFVLQLKIPQPDLPDGMLILNQGLLDSADPRVAAVLLDVDLFHATQFKPDSDAMWDALEVLHRRKNDVFEASITDKTRELIR